MQVMQHDPARLKPFDEVKATLAAEWKKQRVNDMMQQISDKAQAMLQKDPTHPEKVASDLNMQLVRVDGYENGQADSGDRREPGVRPVDRRPEEGRSFAAGGAGGEQDRAGGGDWM